ncbi:MAG TPA: sigma-70 family RNA polymerase sigma factor [Chitinophagaceae bacterium]|nr:sigma-70 family RNA polymerase sigma factor [Chitinophagaceae bacterium]
METNTTYTESDLVGLLKEKDNRAFNYLYDNYSSALYGVILPIVQEAQVANDVLQEVFLNIWRKIETYDPMKGRLFTWMLNIARNASIDTLRSKTYQNSRKNQPLGDNVNSGRYVQTQNVDYIGLKKILEKLKDEQRVLVELAYFKGYTHEEIAALEGIPLGTVKTRIRTALIQLRNYLQ